MANWNTDAQFVDQLSEEMIFTNERMASFLCSNKVFLVVASKGMGKTLLLRYKKQIVESDPRGLIVVPRDVTADYVRLPASLSDDKIHLMERYDFWRDLWEVSIAISALLHFPHDLAEDEITQIERGLNATPLPDDIKEHLLLGFRSDPRRKLQPSDVLIKMLQSSIKSVEKIRATCLHYIFDLYRKYIKSGTCLFIDSFDQALSDRYPDNLDIWMVGQHGLLKAAWEMSRQNNHVKVYASIRQEAYASYKGSEKGNMVGSTLLIEYSRTDLEELLLKAIKYYEDKNSLQDFVGFKKVYNSHLKVSENVLEYIYRHTIGVPRWLMIMGEEISFGSSAMANEKQWRNEFKGIVNRTASFKLSKDYLQCDMKLFVNGEDSLSFIKDFLSLINSSVLTLSKLRRISRKYNERFRDGIERYPFCTLYNIGLLGVICRDAMQNRRVQKFRKPYEFDWDMEGIVPVDRQTYYLIHPSLHQLIYEHNRNYKFDRVLIGDGLPWTEEDEERICKNQIRLFISYSHVDVAIAESIVSMIEEHFDETAYSYDIWFDKGKMKAGQWVQDEIEKGLNGCDYLVILVSKNSLRSNFVSAEWKTKFSEKLKSNENSVLPVVIDDTRDDELPTFLANIFRYNVHTATDKNKEIAKLCADISLLKNEAHLFLERPFTSSSMNRCKNPGQRRRSRSGTFRAVHPLP